MIYPEKGKGDENFLASVPLPNHAKSYTVISHGEIIQKLENELNIEGLVIEGRDYTYSYNGNIALAKVYIKDERDSDLGIAFTWINSYNKQVKFGCGIGGLILENKAVMLGSEGTSWIRMHKGEANEEAYDIIEQLVLKISDTFTKIIDEKNRMKVQHVDDEMFGRIMGALFFEHDLVTPTQANAVRMAWMDPDTECSDKNTLWALYKFLMFRIEMGDIKNWYKSQQKLHHMIMTEYALATEEDVRIGINTSSINTSETDEEDIEEVIEEEVEEVEEVIEADLEVVEFIQKNKHILKETGNDLSFVNVAVQLGYNKLDAEYYVEELYDYEKANSLNLKEFRAWVQEGRKVKEEVVTVIEEVVPIVEETIPVTPTDAFQILASNLGHSKELIDFFIENHFDNDMTLEENIEDFIEWAPNKTSSKKLKVEEIQVDEKPESVIIETSIEEPVTVDVIEDEEDEVIPTQSDDDILSEMEELSFDTEMEMVIDESTNDDEAVLISMDTLFDNEEETSDNESLIGLFKPAVEADEQEDEEEIEEENIDDNDEEELSNEASDNEDNLIETAEQVEEEELPVWFESKGAPETIEPLEIEEEDENPFAIDENEEQEDLLDISDDLERLEPDAELLALASLIEKRMTELYGTVRPYHHEEIEGYINVIIDESLERFSIRI